MGRERLIKSVCTHSLAWQSNEEGAVDRLTAIGYVMRRNEAGEAMLRVNALDVHALQRIIRLLTDRLNYRTHLGRNAARKTAIAILHECLRPHCVYCNGKGHHYQKAQAVRICPYCQGSGLHRFSDTDREVLIGGQYNQRVYDDGLAWIRDSMRDLIIRADQRLNAA